MQLKHPEHMENNLEQLHGNKQHNFNNQWQNGY